jgi:hypothetical protein
VARELEVVARCAARCRESTQYSSSLPPLVYLYVCVYIHIHVYIYIYIYIYTHIHMHIYLFIRETDIFPRDYCLNINFTTIGACNYTVAYKVRDLK